MWLMGVTSLMAQRQAFARACAAETREQRNLADRQRTNVLEAKRTELLIRSIVYEGQNRKV